MNGASLCKFYLVGVSDLAKVPGDVSGLNLEMNTHLTWFPVNLLSLPLDNQSIISHQLAILF
jgi:hypothetical protein